MEKKESKWSKAKTYVGKHWSGFLVLALFYILVLMSDTNQWVEARRQSELNGLRDQIMRQEEIIAKHEARLNRKKFLWIF